MGINAYTADWLLRHHEQGLFEGKRRIAEFGPQDFLFCRNYMKRAAARLHPDPDAARAFYHRIFPENADQCAPDSQKHFYTALGLAEYKAYDYYDARAEYQFDFNYVINMRDRFDVVTNFGTSEHVFNIGATFASMHNLLTVGGLGIFILPAMADIAHGFYNIHPILFKALAHFNKYEIVEHTYVDHAQGRALQHEEDPDNPAPFSDFLELRYDQSFTADAVARFARNLEQERRKAEAGLLSESVYDYNYVILRKLESVRFVWPSQVA